MDLPRIIMVGTDFSPHADVAVRYAVRLACALQARCIIAHAYHSSPLRIEVEARAKLEELRSTYHAVLPTTEWRAVHGDPRDVLPQLASCEGVGRVVVGTHGRGGAARLLLCSVWPTISSTTHHVPC